MSYTISIRIYQTNPDPVYFSIVEKTTPTVVLGLRPTASRPSPWGSGTSCVYRFLSDEGERITIAVGVHNFKRWCDVVTGLSISDRALVINGQYYNNEGRDYMREKQLLEYIVSSTVGTKVQVNYTVNEGNDRTLSLDE